MNRKIWRTKECIATTGVLIYLFCSCAYLDAAPAFGTVMPDRGKWIAGAQANFVFDRYVKDYHSAKSAQYFYNLSFGFADWFSLDGKLGIGDVTVRPMCVNKVHYHANFAGGYGWRAILFEDKKNDIKGIWGFQHISAHPSRKEINGTTYDIIWDDWQMQAVAVKKSGNLYPYCGLKGSILYLIRRIAGDRTRRHSPSDIGVIIGSDLRINDYIYLSVEGVFFDETALNTGFTIKY